MYLYPNFKRVNKNVNISPLHWTNIAVNIASYKDQTAVIKFQFSLFLFKVHFFGNIIGALTASTAPVPTPLKYQWLVYVYHKCVIIWRINDIQGKWGLDLRPVSPLSLFPGQIVLYIIYQKFCFYIQL